MMMLVEVRFSAVVGDVIEMDRSDLRCNVILQIVEIVGDGQRWIFAEKIIGGIALLILRSFHAFEDQIAVGILINVFRRVAGRFTVCEFDWFKWHSGLGLLSLNQQTLFPTQSGRFAAVRGIHLNQFCNTIMRDA